MNNYLKRAWAEINLNNMEQNLRVVRHLIDKDCMVMSVLKADGYGHGSGMCGQTCEKSGVEWFGVANIEEALSLRKYGITKPILVFGFTPSEYIEMAVKNHITLSAFSLKYAADINNSVEALNSKIDIHIKIDTGLNRTGIKCRRENINEAYEEVKALYNLKGLNITGIYTHFPAPDSKKPEDIEFTRNQFFVFKSLLAMLEENKYNVGIRHCCSSTATLYYPEMHLDLVRIGMLQYGMCANDDDFLKYGITPVLTLKSTVIMTKDVSAGETISYARTYKASRPMKIAVVSIGYADGYLRILSNKAKVIIKGHKVPVVGLVCMDYLMADITGYDDISEGDVVTVFGREGDECVSINSIAKVTQGVNGEVTCTISKRVPRVYVYNNEEIKVVDMNRAK